MRAVEHGDLAAHIPDDAETLQLASRLGHALTAHTEHVGYELLGHFQLIARQAIERQQQPTAQLLVDRVVPVTHRGLGHLRDQRLRIAQQHVERFAMAAEFLFEPAAGEPVRVAGPVSMARLGVVSPPMNKDTPMAPSLPTTAISAEAPSCITYSSETIELVGK